FHLAEARAEVCHRVAQLAPPAALSRRVEDFVVLLLQVPVVQKRHHHKESAELLRPEEGVLLPAPVADVLLAFGPRLEADVSEAVALAPLQLPARLRGAADVRARDEVVDL